MDKASVAQQAKTASSVLPVQGLLQRQCACGNHTVAGGECAECTKNKNGLQRKLTIGASNDPLELEADRVADQVMAAPSRTAVSGAPPRIQRYAGQAAEGMHTAPASVDLVLAGSGRPLEPALQKDMSHRFGYDFSRVRVHTGVAAGQSARDVNANAYTVGREIVFGAGRFAPETREGRRLIAHELTHVVQQSGSNEIRLGQGVEKRGLSSMYTTGRRSDADADIITRGGQVAAPTAGREMTTAKLLQREAKPGTSTYQETVVTTSTNVNQPGITEGMVHRAEFGDQRRLLFESYAHVRFDENSCKVTIPIKVSYREPTAGDLTQCPIDKGEKPAGLAAGKGREVFDRYISVVNDRLNGWFTARLDNCQGAKCADKPIPIEVQVKEDNSNPDYTVAVVNASGRSCVNVQPDLVTPGHVVLIGSGGDPGRATLAHEGAHMALGHGDEYAEPGEPVERVRENDFSLLADSGGYKGWAVLHERHFAFVPAFLKSITKAQSGTPCDAKLQELSRPAKLDFRIELSEGYASLSGGGGLYAGGGVNLGILSKNRQLRLGIGPHFGLILPSTPAQKTAYLLGVRVGLEKRFTPSSGGFALGGFGEVGAGIGFKESSKRAPYAEGGVQLGYGFSPMSGVIISVFAEAAAGTTIDPHDKDNQHWFRTGLTGGIAF
ncbi:MAG: DUF4157 domain-containing protein [Methylococcales bacterium]|nr:DUF4157 domain-containing protein [Methylococcales bacterium]